MRTVSNTEVTSWLTCTRQHYYRFKLGVEPKQFSLALTRGIIGHSALEQYYLALQRGLSVDQAKRIMLNYIDSLYATFNLDEYIMLTMLVQLKNLLDAYVER